MLRYDHIRYVATIDRDQAAQVLSGRRQPLFSDAAWVGFEDEGYPSPLRAFSGPALILRMDDWEPAPWRNLGPRPEHAPSAKHARAIARFVAQCPASNLYVHCYAGLYRSGAVAEWLRGKGVLEDPSSYRLVCGGDTERVYNELVYYELSAF